MNASITELPELSLTQVLEYLQAVRRHKWWVYLMTVGLTLTAFVGIALLPNKYKATTTVEVDPQRVPEQFVAELVRISPTDRLQTISQEVLSETRLQQIIDQLNLYPQMRQKSSREAIIEQMRNDTVIEVKQSGGGGLAVFSITYQGKEPTIVADVANRLASDFIQWNLKNREQHAEGTTEFLNLQLQDAKKALQEQETKLGQYKMAHLGELPQQQEALLHTISGLQVELQANAGNLNRLDEERLFLTQLPESVSTSGGNPQSVSERAQLEIEKSQLETKLSDLRRRYTDVFPETQEVLRQLSHVNDRLAALPADKPAGTSSSSKPTATGLRLEVIDREMQRLKDEQRRIREQIADYQAKIQAIPRREQELKDLTRDYDISKGRYDSLLNKSYAADMSNELDTQQKGERFIILDPARIPEKPFKPSRIKYMAFSLFASFFCSVALVFVKEYLDPRVRTEREIRLAYPEPIPLLAAVPHIESPAEHRRNLQFAAFCVSVSILAIGAVAGILWKIHPIL